MARHTTGQGLLKQMAEPAFNQSVNLSDATSGSTQAANDASALAPAAPTVGQVVQARTLLPAPAVRTTAHTPPAAMRNPPPTGPRQEATPVRTPAHADIDSPPTPTVVGVPHTPDTPDAPDTADAHTAPAPPPQNASAPTTPTPNRAPHTADDPTAQHAVAATPPTPAATPAAAAIPAHSATDDTAGWLAAWPRSTRLTYRLKGYYRGDFHGSARVQWQRSAQRYQAQIHVNVALLFDMRMTSQGRITATRLWPEAYEEERRGKRRGARFGDQMVTLDHGGTVNRPAHLQDTASQFVQLAQDFATRRQPLQVNAAVPVTLGRPGGVDDWVYDVVALDTVTTPMGELAAYHLKPRPLANPRGKVSAEIWFAPALQHLPVRIRLSLDPETWLDLSLDSVSQSD